MAYAFVRTYQCTSPPSPSLPTGGWSYRGHTKWQIQPALWPFISAYVVRRPHNPPTLLTVLAESALLLENTTWQPGTNLSWNGAAMSCPSHMSRFLTESLGLCIAISSASAYGWSPSDAILDADRLGNTNPLYVRSGSRPDFIVNTGAGWHGIEARGRGSSGPVGLQRPGSAQVAKIEGLHRWSDQVTKHRLIATRPSWSMSWAWITNTDTWVDHFDPGEPAQLPAKDERAIWQQMSTITSNLSDVDDPRIQERRGLDRDLMVARRPIHQNDGSGKPAWLTVATWKNRMSATELQDRRLIPPPDTKGLRDHLGSLQQTAMGAFMATAITRHQPHQHQISPLLDVIAHQA